MDDEWRFEIPGPQPGVNAAYKVVTHPPFCKVCGQGKPRLGKHERVETWQTEIAWLTRAARPSGWMPGRRVIVEVEWYADRMNLKAAEAGHDSDGPAKPLLDGIAAGLGMDDAPFLFRAMVNEVDRANPRTVVRIRNAPDES